MLGTVGCKYTRSLGIQFRAAIFHVLIMIGFFHRMLSCFGHLMRTSSSDDIAMLEKHVFGLYVVFNIGLIQALQTLMANCFRYS
jgi:hypothetical protein